MDYNKSLINSIIGINSVIDSCKKYVEIISRAQQECKLGLRKKGNGNYYERHHILPKSIFSEFKKCKSNLVLLTAVEHYECHKLLVNIFPGNSMRFALHAFWSRPNSDYKISAEEYAKLREDYANLLRERMSKGLTKSIRDHIKNKSWFNNGSINVFALECPEGFVKGRIFSNEHRANMSIAAKNKPPITEEHRKNQSKSHKGKTVGKENGSFGKHWYTNGKENTLAFECPEGYRLGKYVSQETASKISHSITKNKNHWYTNGKEDILSPVCPEGYYPGRSNC